MFQVSSLLRMVLIFGGRCFGKGGLARRGPDSGIIVGYQGGDFLVSMGIPRKIGVKCHL